jgi:hypothetical protein
MQRCLTGFLPGFSGCYAGETQKARFPENHEATTWGGGCSGSSGFSGSPGEIIEGGSRFIPLLTVAYWLPHCSRECAYPPHHLLSRHPEEPEEPEQPWASGGGRAMSRCLSIAGVGIGRSAPSPRMWAFLIHARATGPPTCGSTQEERMAAAYLAGPRRHPDHDHS